jgi:hypothetical protein
MAFLRQAYGRYSLDLSGEELNAIVDIMDELPSMTKTEMGIYHQITKHRDYLKEEEKWYRTEEARQEVLAEAKLNP